MEDKDVGKSWVCSPLLPPPGEQVTKQLICKLIEERAYQYYLHSGDEEDSSGKACADFSIPYVDYLAAKEGKDAVP